MIFEVGRVNVREAFHDASAIHDGKKRGEHYLFASGLHSMVFLDGENVHEISPTVSSGLTRRLMETVDDRGISFDLIVGVANGGIVIAHDFSKHLATMTERGVLPVVTAQKNGTGHYIRRVALDLVMSKDVLIVDDILTAGTSVRRTAQVYPQAGGNPIALAVWWNRGKPISKLEDMEVIALYEEELPTLTREECAERGPCSRKVKLVHGGG